MKKQFIMIVVLLAFCGVLLAADSDKSEVTATPFKVDGKLVFDNFDGWSWNEEKGYFIHPEHKGGRMGNPSPKMDEKYGHEAIQKISKAQTAINLAFKKIKAEQRELERWRKESKTKRWKNELKENQQALANFQYALKEHYKNKPKNYKIVKGKIGESLYWKQQLDKIYERHEKRKQHVYFLKNFEAVGQKRIAAAKEALHQAYLNMAKVKAEALKKQQEKASQAVAAK